MRDKATARCGRGRTGRGFLPSVRQILSARWHVCATHHPKDRCRMSAITMARAVLPVPLLDLKAQHAAIESELFQAIRTVYESQKFILGPHVALLEEQVAAYCNCRFGVGVSSGTDALLIALMALGVGSGDEVITTPYTFFATGGTVARLGAR